MKSRRNPLPQPLCVGAVLLGCLSLPGSPQARDFATGAMLARACTSRSAAENSLCDGYIAGALDVVAGSAELRAKLCVPPDTKLGALRDAVGRYAQGHAEDAKASGLALLAATLRSDYPCPAR